MITDAAPRLGWWQQTWRLVAAAALGIPFWLTIGILLRGQGIETGSWFVIGDPLVALGCLIALLWRRRFPLAIAMTVAIASTASALAVGAGLLALISISARRRPVEIALVGLAFVTATQFATGFYPVAGTAGPLWLRLTLPMLIAGIAVAAGMAVGARRVELRSLRDRAESAEREQVARAAQARTLERNRIAREMHDVLAHRISLVAMQAGVLDHRRNLTAEQNGELIRGIAEGSHQALEELRDVLGVLRSDPGRPEPPQPSLDRIPELVAEARASGLDVTFTTTVPGKPSELVGRTCYRIVQEGLTNAAKYAPGARVNVTLDGNPGGEVHVGVRNSPATTPRIHQPVSGFGLLGLAERVTLAGGRIDHHPTADSGYVLTARLPWPSHDHEKRS